MSDAQPKTESAKKPLPVQLILLLGFVLLNLAVCGYGLSLVYKSTLGYHAPKITEQELKEIKDKNEAGLTTLAPYFHKLEKFTVNLSGEPKRTIQLELNLEMLDPYGFEEVMDTKHSAKARDRIVAVLNEQNFSDLESLQGKLILKQKIASEINSLMSRGVVKDVYFSQFVVQ